MDDTYHTAVSFGWGKWTNNERNIEIRRGASTLKLTLKWQKHWP